MDVTELRTYRVGSPIGGMVAVCTDGRIAALDFADCTARIERLLHHRYAAFRFRNAAGSHPVVTALAAYFDGELDALRGLDVDPGGTPFQRQVWNALRDISAGTTQSYAQLACAVGRPKAARAVGAANARNPLAVVVPCHRLIGAGGGLTGYAGGLDRKRWLLEHEGCPVGKPPASASSATTG